MKALVEDMLMEELCHKLESDLTTGSKYWKRSQRLSTKTVSLLFREAKLLRSRNEHGSVMNAQPTSA